MDPVIGHKKIPPKTLLHVFVTLLCDAIKSSWTQEDPGVLGTLLYFESVVSLP